VQVWQGWHNLKQKKDRAWYHDEALVVTGLDKQLRALLEIYHNSPMAEHLGVTKTL